MAVDVPSALAERVQRMEDERAIERLMKSYGECVDNNYDLAGLEQLLTDDLVWTSNAFGEYEGRDAYLAGQAEISKGVEWAFHVMSALRVDLDAGGARAAGTFYLLMLATFIGAKPDARVPIVLSARYDNSFVKEGVTWRCNRMRVNFHQVSSLTEGWVEKRYWQP
jgi:ketosteroid isomerase-like protein